MILKRIVKAGVLIVFCLLTTIHSSIVAQSINKKHIISIEGSLCKDKIDFVDHTGHFKYPKTIATETFQFNYGYKVHPNTVLEVGLGKKYYSSLISIDPVIFSTGISQFYNLNQDKIRLFIRQRIYTCFNTAYRKDSPLDSGSGATGKNDYLLQHNSRSNRNLRPVFMLYQVSPGLDFKMATNHHLHIFLAYTFGFQTISKTIIEYNLFRNETVESGLANYSSRGSFSALGISYQYHF